MPITIRGASEHNLRGVDVEIGDGLTVVTGVSGSGKTSLVFDTLYHEARRRFLSIFGAGETAARLAPADVRAITGLGPAVAVGQNLLNRNPASTVATASGLHPLLRLLYARFGERQCAGCGTLLVTLSEDAAIERLVRAAAVGAVTVRAPLLRAVAGSHRSLLDLLASAFGEGALVVDGQAGPPGGLDPGRPHDLDVRLAESTGVVSAAEARQWIETARALGSHALLLDAAGRESVLSLAPVCYVCGAWLGELEPVHFHTRCPHCAGAGCGRCGGTGLHPLAAAVRWQGLRLVDLLVEPVDRVNARFAQPPDLPAAARLYAEIARRLEALASTGLGYLALDRTAPTLSRGEAQRVRLAVILTSRLEDMLHVLDEPTIGLHPADVARFLPVLRRLPGPVVYVEHDRLAAAAADHAVDLGPGAGKAGGRVLFAGAPAALWEADTPSGRFFSGRERTTVEDARRAPPEHFLTVRGGRLHNLQEIDAPIPLARLTAVTGVSGSGKSTLVQDVLVESLARRQPHGCRAVDGPALRPVLVDQSPIGANPRSNPATYTGLADIIRDGFAAATGLSPSHFSFNRPEGACPACRGMGAIEVQMRYLPSSWIPCAACAGLRFSEEVLAAEVDFGRRLSIGDLYGLSIAEAAPLLLGTPWLPAPARSVAGRILEALADVGLGYLSLGQPSPTLSGGEAQRVKLAKYLGQRSMAGHLLVLDEPSTGLHPQDLAGLLVILNRLVRAGATVVVVEHNTDVIRAADWIVDLGPGAGSDGGRLLFAGPPEGLARAGTPTAAALGEEAALRPGPALASPGAAARTAPAIAIRGACAHNLQDVSVDFRKGALTVVTGVSGSGKSSLVMDVLEAEARRRFLESLSMYERQGTREGPEAPVKAVSGLGVAVSVTPERRLYDQRATVGTATEISRHLAVLMARIGARRCLTCGASMVRGELWRCPACGATAAPAQPKHFSPATYAAACRTCQGVGTLQRPAPEKLIIHPERPLCGGAMHSPGFFPKGYLCEPLNGGYDMVQALAARHGFDPATTPWRDMAPEAQQAFLFGDPRPLQVQFRSRSGRTSTGERSFPGFYGWIRDWDTGGTYTDTVPCPDCQGKRLRPEYLAVTLSGCDISALEQMPLAGLAETLAAVALPSGEAALAGASLAAAAERLGFLKRVGLGYLHLSRSTCTLSAGEAQRIKLAGLLGSGLTSLTVLLDEPTRGLHPAEVEALLGALKSLRDEGNTVIVVEHDPAVIRAADVIVELGPGAGAAGGRIVSQGTPAEVAAACTAGANTVGANTTTGAWLRGERRIAIPAIRRAPRGWLTIHGARANNLRGDEVRLPLGVLVGVCGVSGSGKSTLVIDTLARALAPVKHTTSVAREPIAPGAHDAIEGAPSRTLIVDQSRASAGSPIDILGLSQPLRRLYVESADARARGLGEAHFARTCSACGGKGAMRIDMGFLPAVYVPCETCRQSGCLPEAWDVRLRGLALPELLGRTIDEAYGLWQDVAALARPLAAARDVGLGYLVLRQPGHALSGGEAQRLKIAGELRNAHSAPRRAPAETLYILDEPTVGQHLEDVARLTGVLDGLVAAGHSVIVIEHHPHLLAACDWLVELGPGGGREGGRLIASGTPETLARGATATAPCLREILEGPA